MLYNSTLQIQIHKNLTFLNNKSIYTYIYIYIYTHTHTHMYIFKALFITTHNTSEISPPVLYDHLLPVMNGIKYHISGQY